MAHLAANPHYGFFRDELYFIVCGRHPQWGYVDQPPIVPLLAAFTQLAGHSLFLLRAIPALLAAAATYATVELTRNFGGGRFAQALAALVFFFTPVLLSFGLKVGTDEVGLCTWPLLALLALKLTRGASPYLWITAGVVTGVSFESKYSVIFFVVALVVGLLATRKRYVLVQGGFLLACVTAALIALPNALWQLHYGLPMLELLHNGQAGKNLIVSPLMYFGQEAIITNPLLTPVWLIGLGWLLRSADARFLGYAYLLLIAEMLVLHGKHYYPANVYPILIAAGCVPIESWSLRMRGFRIAIPAYITAAGLLMLPDALPILPENTYVALAAQRERLIHFSLGKVTETEHGREASRLPGDWADMHGWAQMARRVQAVYDALPPDQRREAVVFAGNYGEASAVAFYTPQVPVISEHNQYWLWGTAGATGKVLIQINGTCFVSDRLYATRTRAATLDDPDAIAYEAHAPIWICRNPRKGLAQIWPALKTYE